MAEINYDMHIHTEYCGHAENMTIEAILRRADELGLDTICIADHIYSNNELDTPAKIKEQVAKIKTSCSVIIGAEIDVDGAYCDGTLASETPENIDYIIAGIHYVPGAGNFPCSIEDNHLSPDELIKRWRTTLLGVVQNPSVKTLAHPGRMIAAAVDLDIFFDNILEIFAEAALVSARNEVLWEINEHDRDKIRTDYLDKWHCIYEIGLNAGVKLIYGSDAHLPENIGQTEFTHSILKVLPDNCLQTPASIGLIENE